MTHPDNAELETLCEKLDTLELHVSNRLTSIEQLVTSRVDGLETRFGVIEARFDRIEARFDRVDLALHDLVAALRAPREK